MFLYVGAGPLGVFLHVVVGLKRVLKSWARGNVSTCRR